MKSYDVLIIGSGGGTKLCTPVARLGKKVAIIEEGKWGGTCLNRGCIPSKMFIHPANVAQNIRHANKYEIQAKITNINFPKLVRRINRETDKDSRSIPPFYDGVKGLTYYQGHGRFVANNIVEVNGQKLTAKKIFVATGARPFIPPVPGLKGTPYMTSKEALRNKHPIKKLLVVGGGYIGCELGHAYGGLGSDVHVVVRGRALVEREDKEISQAFTKAFANTYNVHFGWDTKKVSYTKKTFTLHLENKAGKKKTLTGDGLLIATGVKPNSYDLGIENTTIKLNKRGFIQVNRFMETTATGVYALGDVVGNYLFRHSVNFEGEFLFNSLFKEKKRKAIKYPPMPHAVFSYPEIGGVGKTEEELIAAKIPYVKGVNTYAASAQGMARLPEFGFAKVLIHKKTRKLLGAHILGDEASIMIHQCIYAMTFNASIDDMLKMIYIHPALPEILRNACRKAKAALD